MGTVWTCHISSLLLGREATKQGELKEYTHIKKCSQTGFLQSIKYQRFECINFPEFVAISLNRAAKTSLDYKAMASFSRAVGKHTDLPTEDQLRIWITAMIDGGISLTTRRRYVEKLSSVYKDFEQSAHDGDDPFGKVRELRDMEISSCSKNLQDQCSWLSDIFNILLQDAKNRPEIAIFLYLLLNASSDIERAVSLRTEEYVPVFPQLDEIIDPSIFHHRRKYVFDLNQSRKRMPQLVREVVKVISEYLSDRGIRFENPFTPRTIVSLWTVKARESGVTLPDLKSVLDIIPTEYEYMKYVRASGLTDERKLSVKKGVAEAFSPTEDRWYAMKLRRGVSFDDVMNLVHTESPNNFQKIIFFYPKRTTVKRVGKKMVKDMVPYIEDVLFLKIKQTHIVEIDRIVKHEGRGWIFRQTNSPNSDYSVIDRRAMRTFQRAVGEFTPDMKIELTQAKPIGIGRKVRITGGAFVGYTGTIYNIGHSEDNTSRRIYIKLSEGYGINVELKIDDFLIEPVEF